MKKIHVLVNDKRFESLSLVVITLSVINLTLQTFDPGGELSLLSWVAEISIVSFFTIEYILRIIADKKYVRTGWSAVDLLAIVPFYLGLIFPFFWDATLALRILRYARIVRILKFTRFKEIAHTASVFGKSIMNVRTELLTAIFGSTVIMYISSLFIYFAEKGAQPEGFGSVFDAMWWAVTTITTVGYGDLYPITVPGRIFAMMTMICGIGLFGAFTGIIASAMFKTVELLKEEKE